MCRQNLHEWLVLSGYLDEKFGLLRLRSLREPFPQISYQISLFTFFFLFNVYRSLRKFFHKMSEGSFGFFV